MPFLSPGDLPNPGSNLVSLHAMDLSPLSHLRKPTAPTLADVIALQPDAFLSPHLGSGGVHFWGPQLPAAPGASLLLSFTQLGASLSLAVSTGGRERDGMWAEGVSTCRTKTPSAKLQGPAKCRAGALGGDGRGEARTLGAGSGQVGCLGSAASVWWAEPRGVDRTYGESVAERTGPPRAAGGHGTWPRSSASAASKSWQCRLGLASLEALGSLPI